MRAKTKEDKLLMDCFRELFRESTPSGDFDELVANATLNERGQKVIPFDDYEIDDDLFHSIVDKYSNQVNPRWKRYGFRNQLFLGPSPRSKMK